MSELSAKYHVVKVHLEAIPSKNNKIWIDGTELRNVTDFKLEASKNDVTAVTVRFYANVDGNFEHVPSVSVAEGAQPE